MKATVIGALALVLALGAGATAFSQQAGTPQAQRPGVVIGARGNAGWDNPNGMLTLPNMPLHDPFMVADKATKTYYLFTSNQGRLSGTQGLGTMAYTSKDLKNWTRPKAVFILPQGTWANGGAWAPEVHQWKGKWYLFTTFHNEAWPIGGQQKPNRTPYRRGAVIAVSDTLDGPFTLINSGEPPAGKDRMTLDGTLYVDRKGKPWFVYAGEWLQETDGTIEAMPLTDELAPAGPARVLFRASAGPWVAGQPQNPNDVVRVTDGPQLGRTKNGDLTKRWSSYDRLAYAQSIARSKSGELDGPWEQRQVPLLRGDSGHGMMFETFDGVTMLVVHRPFDNARGKLYEVRDTGKTFEILRQRTDLDGDPPEVDALVRPDK